MSNKIQTRETRLLTSNFANDNIEIYSSQQCIGYINDVSTIGFMFFSKTLYNIGSNLELEIEVPNMVNRIMLQVNVRWNDPEINAIGVKVFQEYLAVWQKLYKKLK